jgi:hypothetical protein
VPGRPRGSASTGETPSTTVRVSPTDADPLAALRISRIAVDLGDRRFIIPALPARDWLEVLLDEDLNPEEIFPGFCGTDDIIAVNQMLLDGEVTMDQMTEAIYSVLEQATGRRWWVAIRLCRTIRAGWDRIGGRLASHGVTPFDVPLAYWLDGAYDAVLGLIMEADPKGLGSFTQKLTAPPPGMAKALFDRTRANEAFRANMNRARQGR